MFYTVRDFVYMLLIYTMN